ncbi:hypothetical protein AVEN_240868-1 [Araneus ventricosus]|uniref:Uncharacterized protein n=1 Tax=Araneus ventricosus TaxID=182803 RepID=A0A4Y2MNA4_ARAVE|nr:hypothetical protein AVEN_240868-1 [Araneus ventricosus]
MQLEFPSQPKPSGTPDGTARSGPAQHDNTSQHKEIKLRPWEKIKIKWKYFQNMTEDHHATGKGKKSFFSQHTANSLVLEKA